MFKAYTSDNDLYKGNMKDNLERKFALYLERCDQNNFDNDTRKRGFSIILCGIARQFYFDKLRDKDISLEQLADAVKRRSNTEEQTRALLRE